MAQRRTIRVVPILRYRVRGQTVLYRRSRTTGEGTRGPPTPDLQTWLVNEVGELACSSRLPYPGGAASRSASAAQRATAAASSASS